MKTLYTFALLLALSPAFCQNTNYDEALAKKLGADEYGMRMYQLVILKTGSNSSASKDQLSEWFQGHMANIHRMAEEGKLTVAGPFGKNEDGYRGIFILNVSTREEALELLKRDPVVANQVMVADIIPWYGSAALPEYLEVHKKIEKAKP